jgi:hypothetical protein
VSADVDEVMFDILLRPASRGDLPHAGNVQEFHAAPEQIERCRRWFAANGMTLYATPFGLSGSTSRESFEKTFNVELEGMDGGPRLPAFQATSEPQPPAEIADAINQITLTAPPELF